MPALLKESAYGLGATTWEVVSSIVLPYTKAGVIGGIMLGLGRAIGETMIVALAAGAGSKLTFNPFQGAETMTGHIVRISGGDISYQSIDYDSLFSIALLLFFMITASSFFGTILAGVVLLLLFGLM